MKTAAATVTPEQAAAATSENFRRFDSRGKKSRALAGACLYTPPEPTPTMAVLIARKVEKRKAAVLAVSKAATPRTYEEDAGIYEALSQYVENGDCADEDVVVPHLEAVRTVLERMNAERAALAKDKS